MFNYNKTLDFSSYISLVFSSCKLVLSMSKDRFPPPANTPIQDL